MACLYHKGGMNNQLFKNKYRKDSLRLRNWDYSWHGNYFVTICVKDKNKPWFGEVENEQMELSTIGKITNEFWIEIPKHFFNVRLDAHVIMPNHMHGIIKIENIDDSNVETSKSNSRDVALQRLYRRGKIKNQRMSEISPKPRSPSAIIRSYKSVVKRWCNKNGYSNFSWQPRFYEHMIRDEKAFYEIREYIQYNPLKWDLDKENPDCKK